MPMQKTLARIQRFMDCEEGPAAVEYAIMLALIVIVCLAAIRTMGNNSNKTFKRIAKSIAS
jgi:pilus assembly protein Flp/PilA